MQKSFIDDLFGKMINAMANYGRSIIELLAWFMLNKIGEMNVDDRNHLDKTGGMNVDNRKHTYHHFSFVKIGATRPYDD